MRVPPVPAVLGTASVLVLVLLGPMPALAQEFSITNPVKPASAGHRDVLRQLQAWWDLHAYYPRRASGNNKAGTVRVRLVIRPDGSIWMIDVVESSGSASLDTAAMAAFRGGFVQPFPAGEPER